MRPGDAGRPGLLLVCYGDFPGELLNDPEGQGLYRECLTARELMAGHLYGERDEDTLAGLSGRIASFLSDEADGPVALGYLGFRRPGIREALYRAASSGPCTIVCVGGAGLMLPSHSASVHLPAVVKAVTADNPGLDVLYVMPGLNAHVASGLVMASVEGALSGRSTAPQPSGDAPRIQGDLGVLVASASDHTAALARCGQPGARFTQASRSLSEAAVRRDDGMSGLARFMSGVARVLEETGAFSAVETGYIDFSVPDLVSAARRLVAAGSRRIIAAGMPSLLHRHAFSWAHPSSAIDHLKRSLDVDLIYVKPDPTLLSREIASILRMKVLEARTKGVSLKGDLRKGRNAALFNGSTYD